MYKLRHQPESHTQKIIELILQCLFRYGLGTRFETKNVRGQPEAQAHTVTEYDYGRKFTTSVGMGGRTYVISYTLTRGDDSSSVSVTGSMTGPNMGLFSKMLATQFCSKIKVFRGIRLGQGLKERVCFAHEVGGNAPGLAHYGFKFSHFRGKFAGFGKGSPGESQVSPR